MSQCQVDQKGLPVTNPIQNLVPNVVITAEALKVLDTDKDAKVTVEELNNGLAGETVQFNAQGRVDPKPVTLLDAPPSAPPKDPPVVVAPATPPKAPAATVAAAPNARTKGVMTLVDEALKRVADKHVPSQKLSALETAWVAINREIQDAKPLFSPNIRETAAMAVMNLLQNKALNKTPDETVTEGLAGLATLRDLLNSQ
jgi:hypothetical protein